MFNYIESLNFYKFFSRKKLNRCILLFEGRTGSSWLIQMLQQSPDISFLGETLAEIKDKGWTAQEEWIKKLFNDPFSVDDERIKRGIRVIAFKIKLRDIADDEKFKTLIEDYGCKIIHMKRDNIIKQVVSSIRAIDLYERNGIYNIDEKNKDMALGSYEIPVERFDMILRWISDAEEKLSMFIDSLSVPTLHITYENLLNSYDNTLDKVFSFLNAERIDPVPTTLKHTSDNLIEIILNYEELKRYYENSPYGVMFE